MNIYTILVFTVYNIFLVGGVKARISDRTWDRWDSVVLATYLIPYPIFGRAMGWW